MNAFWNSKRLYVMAVVLVACLNIFRTELPSSKGNKPQWENRHAANNSSNELRQDAKKDGVSEKSPMASASLLESDVEEGQGWERGGEKTKKTRETEIAETSVNYTSAPIATPNVNVQVDKVLATEEEEGGPDESNQTSDINQIAQNVEDLNPPTKHGEYLSAKEMTVGKPTSGKQRILLGIRIMQAGWQNRRLRVIRHSYLEYHKKMNTTNTVCSLPQVLAAENPDDCQLVFALVYPGAEAATDLNKLIYIFSGKATKKEHDRFVENNYFYEEAVLLKTTNSEDDYTTIVEWMKWSLQLDENRFGKFDYTAFATTGVTLLPTIFWNQNQMLVAQQHHLFGGVQPFHTSNCTTPCLNHNFLIFSRDIAQTLGSAPELPQGSASIVTGIWNLLQSDSTGNELQIVPVKGVIQTDWPGVPPLEKATVDLAVWDAYIAKEHEFEDAVEEELVRNSPAKVTTFQGNGRVLIGIMTTNLKLLERQRRQVIRDTWVQYYANTSTPHRICSLQQLVAKEVPEEECQIAYTFVIGAGSDTSPTEMVHTNDINAMVIPKDQIKDSEPDVVYLSVRENMNKGKTDTWFRYAALTSNTLYFDYFGKMDTDTVLIPPRFIDMLNMWPTFPHNIRTFLGDTIVTRDFQSALGAAYFNGGFFIMSTDLARYITTIDRTGMTRHDEDLNIGNYVNSNPKLLNRKMLNLYCNFCRKHPVKRVENYPKFYRDWTNNPPRKPDVVINAINGLLNRYNISVGQYLYD